MNIDLIVLSLCLLAGSALAWSYAYPKSALAKWREIFVAVLGGAAAYALGRFTHNTHEEKDDAHTRPTPPGGTPIDVDALRVDVDRDRDDDDPRPGDATPPEGTSYTEHFSDLLDEGRD